MYYCLNNFGKSNVRSYHSHNSIRSRSKLSLDKNVTCFFPKALVIKCTQVAIVVSNFADLIYKNSLQCLVRLMCVHAC